jgi:hypothetical protein
MWFLILSTAATRFIGSVEMDRANKTAAMMPISTTTTVTSTSVKPRLFRVILVSLLCGLYYLLNGRNHIVFAGGSQEKAVVLGSCKYVEIRGDNVVNDSSPF